MLASYLKEDRHAVERVLAVTKILNRQQDWTAEEFSRAYRIALKEIDSQRRTYVAVFPICGRTELLEVVEDLLPKEIRVFKYPLPSAALPIENVRQRQRLSNQYEDLFDGIFRYNADAQIHVTIEAASPLHARILARDLMDTALGALCLCSNFTRSKISVPLQLPVGELLIAPQSTIHLKDGSLVNETFWFESWIGAPCDQGISEDGREVIEKNFKKTMKDLKKSKWSEQAHQALRLFFQFTIEPDVKAAFLLGWQLLEFLVSGERTTYDTVVDRACRFFADFEYAKVSGTYFKDVRNHMAHGSNSMIYDDREILYSFKEFVRPVLTHFVANPFSFRSIGEFLVFCDAGTTEDEVSENLKSSQRHLHAVRSAASFIKPRKT